MTLEAARVPVNDDPIAIVSLLFISRTLLFPSTTSRKELVDELDPIMLFVDDGLIAATP